MKIKARLYGTVQVEDPRCPSEWHGSGCYDIDVPATQEVTVTMPGVTDKEDAKRMAKAFCYESESGCQVENVHEVMILECISQEDADVELEFDFSDAEWDI